MWDKIHTMTWGEEIVNKWPNKQCYIHKNVLCLQSFPPPETYGIMWKVVLSLAKFSFKVIFCEEEISIHG